MEPEWEVLVQIGGRAVKLLLTSDFYSVMVIGGAFLDIRLSLVRAKKFKT